MDVISCNSIVNSCHWLRITGFKYHWCCRRCFYFAMNLHAYLSFTLETMDNSPKEPPKQRSNQRVLMCILDKDKDNVHNNKLQMTYCSYFWVSSPRWKTFASSVAHFPAGPPRIRQNWVFWSWILVGWRLRRWNWEPFSSRRLRNLNFVGWRFRRGCSPGSLSSYRSRFPPELAFSSRSGSPKKHNDKLSNSKIKEITFKMKNVFHRDFMLFV